MQRRPENLFFASATKASILRHERVTGGCSVCGTLLVEERGVYGARRRHGRLAAIGRKRRGFFLASAFMERVADGRDRKEFSVAKRVVTSTSSGTIPYPHLPSHLVLRRLCRLRRRLRRQDDTLSLALLDVFGRGLEGADAMSSTSRSLVIDGWRPLFEVERVVAKRVLEVLVGARLEEHLDDLVAAIAGGEDERRVAEDLLHLDLRLRLEEPLDHLDVAVAGGPDERRVVAVLMHDKRGLSLWPLHRAGCL